jgi:hypothetical protein
LTLGILFLCKTSYSQKDKVIFSGNLGLYWDLYSMQSNPSDKITARRPSSVPRLMFVASATYKKISIPVTIILSGTQTNVTTPIPYNQNLIQYIQNPMNNVSIAPKYKWAQLLLGTQIPQYSELTTGNIQTFGAGFNLTPGKFRFSVFGGTSQRAIERDSIHNISGSYARRMIAAKIGFGDNESAHIFLNVVKAYDDTSSVKQRPTTIRPEDGIVSSIDLRLKFLKQYFIQTEVAGSAFSRNEYSREIVDKPVAIPTGLFVVRTSSRLHYAGVLSLGRNGKKVSIKATSHYYGDGFVPLGYAFVQTDRLDGTIDLRLNLVNNKLNIGASVGKRINNLSGIMASTATQNIYSINVNGQVTEAFNISAQYSNFGFKNTVTNDTFKIAMVSHSMSITPSYTIIKESSQQIISGIYSRDISIDYNVVSGSLNNNNSQTIMLIYMRAKKKTPFTWDISISDFNNELPSRQYMINTLSTGIGYKFYKNRIQPNLKLNLMQNKMTGYSDNYQVGLTLNLIYKINKSFTLNLYGSTSLFLYGSERKNVYYQENLLRTALTYKF